jgi:TonB family protein
LRHPLVIVRVLVLALALGLAPRVALAQDAIREEVKQHEPKLTKPPALLKFVPALYPPEAQRKGIGGTVELSIDIDAKGAVSRLEVLSSPDPDLSASATAAVKQFVFSPGEVDGQVAPVRILYAYNFVLEIAFIPRLPDWMEEGPVRRRAKDNVVGRAREQGTRIPLPGIGIAIPQLGVEVKTDENGAFGFEAVAHGGYKIEAVSLEHKRETVDIEVREGEQTRIDFYLQRLAANPYETVVRGQRRKTVVTRVTLRQKELTTVPGTFGDPIRVIENLPGVARVPYVGGALLIRGSAPGDSGVYLDGTKIPILYHFLGGPSVLHPEFLDRIDYYPGNADVRYGRLLAGVVDVSTKNAYTNQWGGSLDVNLLNTAAYLKVPIADKVSISAAFRRSYIDAILPSILRMTSRSATTVVPIYYDYQVRADVKLAGDDQLFVLVFGSDDSLGIASNQPDQDVSLSIDTHIAFHRILAQWRKQISDRLVSKLVPAVGYDIVSMSIGDTKINLQSLDITLREDLEYRLSKRVTLRAGADFEVSNGWYDTEVPLPVDYRNPGSGLSLSSGNAGLLSTETQKLQLTNLQTGFGIYTDALINLTSKLQLIPGVRFELMTYGGNKQFTADPRLTARYALFTKTTLKAAAGMYSKAPDPNQYNDTFGNPRLTLAHGAQFSVGAEQTLPFYSPITIDAQLYYNLRYNNFIATNQYHYDSDGTYKALRFTNQGNAYSYGLELLIKHDVTRWFYGWISYTLSRSMEQRKPDGDYVPFTFDQTHILTLVASVRIGTGWEVGTRFRLVSGRPTTPVLDSFYDSDLARYRQILGDAGSDRLPLFHQLDFRVEKTWIFRLWRLSAYLDIQNIYNAENPEATLYDYRYRQSGPLRGLPFLPSFGIKGSF